MSGREFLPVDVHVLAALVRDDADSLAQGLADPDFDGSRFAHFAVHHQVAGFLQAVLDGRPERVVLSRGADGLITRAYLQQWATNERVALELRRVSGALDIAGCPFVLLKGLHLACAYYDGSDRRGISDLDLLVHHHDLGRAAGVLEGCDFSRRSRALFGRRVASLFVHAFEFDRGAVPVDLHWQLASHPSYRIDYGRLWSTCRSFDAEGTRVRVLDHEYALTFALLGVAKDLELGTVRLKAFVDLYKIVATYEREGSWPSFFEARSRERTARTAAGVLTVLLRLFGAREQFPSLDEFLTECAPPRLPDGLVERLAAGRRSTGDRLWTARLYDCSVGLVWAWWAASLPFRVAAHRVGRPMERAAQ